MFLVSTALTWVAVGEIAQVRALSGAVSTTGRVLSTTIVKERKQVSTGTGGPRRSGTSQITVYTPVVRYQYEADGRSLVGENVFPPTQFESQSNWFRTESAARNVTDRYEPGDKCEVRHRADHPEQAYLISRFPSTPGIAALISGLLALVSAGFMIRVLRQSLRPVAATALLGLAGWLAHFVWSTYWTDAAAGLTESAVPLGWLLILFVAVAVLVWGAHAPSRFEPIRKLLFSAAVSGILFGCLSLVVIVPMLALAPKQNAIGLFPWAVLLGAAFGAFGVLTGGVTVEAGGGATRLNSRGQIVGDSDGDDDNDPPHEDSVGGEFGDDFADDDTPEDD